LELKLLHMASDLKAGRTHPQFLSVAQSDP
jgi:hypothetical protein